jgi:hypothetical protein
VAVTQSLSKISPQFTKPFGDSIVRHYRYFEAMSDMKAMGLKSSRNLCPFELLRQLQEANICMRLPSKAAPWPERMFVIN